MPDRPGDVKKKLDELYRQTEDIRQNLIQVHHMLTNTGFFEAPRPQYQPQPVYVPPPVMQQVAQPAPPEPVTETYVPPGAEQERFTAAKKQRAPEPGFFERHPDFEKFIGERLVTFIGIAVLVTGIAFFVKYAIDRDWINEIGRTAIGILCGGILIGVAHRLRRSYTTFSSVLAGGGIAVLYFTISYAFQVYHLFSQPAALGILVVVTLFTVLLSVAYDRKELAILAIIGGFASPLMVRTGDGNFIVLCSYMLILDAGMLVLAYYKKWNVVTVLAYVFTILFYTVALQKDILAHPHEHDHEAFVFATMFYLVFFSMNIINNLKARRKFESFEIISLLSNTGLYYAVGYFLLHHMDLKQFTGLFTLIVALFNCTFAFALFRRQNVDRNLVYFLVGIVITLVSLAAPVQLEGNHITLFWAAEAVFLLWFYQKSGLNIVKVFALILNVVLVLSVVWNWLNVYSEGQADLQLLVNKGFITTSGAVISLALTAYLLDRKRDERVFETWTNSEYRKLTSVFALVILFLGGFFELSHQAGAAGYSKQAIGVFTAGYATVFLLFAWFGIRHVGMEFFRWTLRITVIVMLILAVIVPHFAIAQVRNAWLAGAELAFAPFLFHYVYTTGLFVLGSVVLRETFTAESATRQFRNFYLWLFSIFLVFMLSAELDHAMVMSYAYNPANPLWIAHEVSSNIEAGIAMSHKVGFPIIWGICSFAMMAIGMRRKNRQIRIISLVLFSLTVVKLVLLGIYGESQSGKIVAFILCGVILLLVSFMYQKLKKIFMDDTVSNQKQAHE